MARQVENSDLKTLVACIISVILTWWALFRWNFSDAIAGNDALSINFPVLVDFIRNGADWQNLIYRPQLLGGAKIHDAGHLFPIFTFWAKLGFSAITVISLSVLSIQVLFGFLASRAALDLSMWWQRSHRNRAAYNANPDWFSRFGLAWITCFAPILAWRLTWGHLNQILGCLPFIAAISLVAAFANYRFSFTLIFIVIASLLTAFASSGQQPLLYTLVFGAPVLIAIAWPLLARYFHSMPLERKVARRLLVVSGFAIMAALGLAMPKLVGMAHHAWSDDVARSASAPVIWSYQLFTWRDFFASLPFGLEAFLQSRPMEMGHEFNLPVGPMLLFFLLIPWKRTRIFVTALGTVGFLALLFSMKVGPLAELIPKFVPLVNAFRCPHRILILFVLLVPIFGGATLLYRFTNERRCHPIVGWAAFAVGLGLLGMPSLPREILAWSAVLALTVLHLAKQKKIFAFGPGPVLVAMGFLSIAAFNQRRHPAIDTAPLIKAQRDVSSELVKKVPDLANPLIRSVWPAQMANLDSNTAYAMGFSSVNGYWYPSLRQLKLIAALDGKPVDHAIQNLTIRKEMPAFRPLRQLYNIRYAIVPPAEYRESWSVEKLGTTAGAAWFSAKLQRLKSEEALAGRLGEAGDRFPTIAYREAWVLPSDRAVYDADLPADAGDRCDEAHVLGYKPDMNGQRVTLDVATPDACPLTISMNYASDLVARSVEGETIKPLTLFPSYGTLAGVWVPAGTRKIVVEARPYLPWQAKAAWWAGLLAAVMAMRLFAHTQSLILSRRQEPPLAAPKKAA